MVRAGHGLATRPGVPVTPDTNRRGSTRPSASSGTLASSTQSRNTRVCHVGRGQSIQMLGTAQVNSLIRSGAP